MDLLSLALADLGKSDVVSSEGGASGSSSSVSSPERGVPELAATKWVYSHPMFRQKLGATDQYLTCSVKADILSELSTEFPSRF
jgi:hypothetical protein